MIRGLEPFLKAVENPYKTVSEWKERTGKKVIGCYPMWLPRELVHAAGLLPVVVWRSDEPVTIGHAYVHTFNCGLTRSFVDDAVRGKLDFIDGFIIYRTCLQAQELPFILEQHVRPAYLEYLYLPAIFPGAATKDFLIEELERFKASLEEFTGKEITDEELRRSIELYNENRRMLRRFYEFRRKNLGVLRAREVMAVVWSSMLVPKEEHNTWLRELLLELEERQEELLKEPRVKGDLKVVLTGALCQTPQLEILDMIEDLGMVVVDDDLYVGSKYFANDVELDGNKRPLEALAEHYLKREPTCPTKGDWEMDWTDEIAGMVKRGGADGVISLLIKFCPPHLCYYPDIKRGLMEAGVPEVMIEVEHEIVSLEGVRTRLQSFAESLRRGA
ncbi:2-hydroxyacyl-CoA dehydratase subunit D [Candidatus Alkanophaga liquidiphilum]